MAFAALPTSANLRFDTPPPPARAMAAAFTPPLLLQQKRCLLGRWNDVQSIAAFNAITDDVIMEMYLEDMNLCDKQELHLLPVIGRRLKNLQLQLQVEDLMTCQKVVLLQLLPRAEVLSLARSDAILDHVVNFMQNNLIKLYLKKSLLFQERDVDDVTNIICSFISLEEDILKQMLVIHLPHGFDASELQQDFPVTFVNPMPFFPIMPVNFAWAQ